MTNTEYAGYLHEMADAIGGCEAELNLHGQTIVVSCNYPSASAAERMAAVVKGLGGKFEKHENDGDYELVRMIGPNKILVYSSHENVCEKVTTIEQVEVTKWVCPSSILELAVEANEEAREA